MAYPTISAPYGFRPINRYDGIPYAGATLQYPITASTAIYYGDTVKLVASGNHPASCKDPKSGEWRQLAGCIADDACMWYCWLDRLHLLQKGQACRD